MIGHLVNHVWQSTAFAAAAALLTLAFRLNRAQVRYAIWFTASAKFLMPFALLMTVGSHFHHEPWPTPAAAQVTRTVELVSTPFPIVQNAEPLQTPQRDWISIVAFAVWGCGFASVAIFRVRSWRRLRVAVQSSAVAGIAAPIQVRVSKELFEPGVFGWRDPVLIVPEGLLEGLSADHFRAVLAHEICHVRRCDNLTALVHMITEALFWFHPMVWWIGARLIEERERACDENVLRLGGEPKVYAEAILSVCKFYLESPLVCISGITGSNLRKRIEAIMAQHIVQNLNLTRKLLLAAGGIAAVVAPIGIGLLNSPAVRAQSPAKEFEVVSVKPSAPNGGFMFGPQPGGLRAIGMPLKMLIMQAYDIKAFQVSGGPNWIGTERWDILAKVEGTEGRIPMAEVRPMLKALLRDRFQLKIHTETKELPVFALEVGKNGSKLAPNTGTEQFSFGVGSLTVKKGGTEALAAWLSQNLGRVVIDKTGLKGEYDYELEWTPDPGQGGPQSIGLPPELPPPHVDTNGPSIFTAVQEQLGLRLVSQKGPVCACPLE